MYLYTISIKKKKNPDSRFSSFVSQVHELGHIKFSELFGKYKHFIRDKLQKEFGFSVLFLNMY